jgi:hypothetical protein
VAAVTDWIWIDPGSSMPDYRRPGLPAQEETSPKPEDKTKKNYRLIRTSGYWELWMNMKTREQKWLTDREASGLSGKTFQEAWFDADIRFKPSGADD